MSRNLLNPNSLSPEPTLIDVRRALVDLWYTTSPFSASQSDDYTTTGAVAHERVIMTNTQSRTVSLCSNPKDLEEVTIKRMDAQVTIDGNGKTIDGLTEMILGSQYDAPNLVYTDAAGEWSIM